jgi:sarcosine oxidase
MAYDVIVLGLGGMGSAAAAHLARRGQRVLGLERFGPAHDQGSSHGGSRIIRQAYFEDPAYVPLLLRAYELWERLEADTGEDLLTLTGGLMIGPEDSRTVRGSLRSARAWDLAHEVLGGQEVRRRFPTLAPGPTDIALYESEAGFLRPEAVVRAQLAEAERAGADLRFEEPALGWEALEGGVRVRSATGTHEAGRLVVSPGPWAPAVLGDLGLPLVVERQVQYWFDPPEGIDAFLPGRQPIWIWEEPDGVQFYGFPAVDGAGGGVKTAFFRMGEQTTPDTIDRAVHPDEVERMRGRLRRSVPGLDGPLLRATTCMYTTTPDEHFVVDRHPALPQVTLAAGFSGHGFKFVSVVGEILADLSIEGVTAHDISLFRADRWG